MGLTIYGTARSRTARVLWMAKELGLAFEHVPLMMGDAALKQPPFLKISPAGCVPAIDDDGFVMAESLAINLYLARKYGDRATPSLAPASLEQEARIWQWSSWAMTDLEGPLNLIHLHRSFFPPEKRTRLPLLLGWRPSPASRMPAFTSSSLNLPMSVRSSSLGIAPASEFFVALIITMTRIVVLLWFGERLVAVLRAR